MSETGKLIYSGKAKSVYETENPNQVLIKFRDDITAGDGEKKDSLQLKGFYNSLISSKLFEILTEAGVKTQYVELLEPGEMVCKKLEMIPLEVIARNIAAGSIARKFPFEEKKIFDEPVLQIDYKNDEYHDPMLNRDIAIALGITTEEELNEIRNITLKINKTLKDFFASKGIKLVDFKIEFGHDNEGNIILGDEISPDTCRLWDIETDETLDKDLFRRGEGGVMDAYKQVIQMTFDDKDYDKFGIDKTQL